MNGRALTEGVAVVCDRQDHAAALVEAYLRTHGGTDAEWYAPCDADEVDKAVRAGDVRRVVFPTLSAFLAALWDEVLTVEMWQAPGVGIEFADSECAVAPAQVAAILACWQHGRHRRRRQRAMAGLILSALALAAAWTVVGWAR